MKIGIIVGGTFPGKAFREAMELAAEIGYACVEFPAGDVDGNSRDSNIGGMAEEEILELVSFAGSLGLEVSSFQCHFYPIGFLSPQAQERRRRIDHTRRMVDMAARCGVGIVHTLSGVLPRGMSDPHAWEILCDTYEQVLDHAAPTGVKVGIEPAAAFFIKDYTSTQKLFDIVNRDDLYLNLDPSHYVYSRESPLPVIENFGHKIVHMHAKDAVVLPRVAEEVNSGRAWDMGQGEQFDFALPGHGVLDWKDIIEILRKVGYDYVLSTEYGHVRGADDREKAARENFVFLQHLLETI